MKKADKGVSSAIATVLMVAIVVVLAATVSVSFFDVAEDVNEPAPNVADTTGEFRVTPPDETAGDNQIVQITHVAGDNVPVAEIEIIVRAFGPELNAELRLVNLPSEGDSLNDATNFRGDDIVDEGSSPQPKVVVEDTPADNNQWEAGETVQFRITTGGADFRDSAQGDPNEADELEVIIVHTPSNSILAEHTFTPQRS